MFKYNPLLCWPSAEDLPDSDDTPVDNQLQDLIPGLLGATLALVWQERKDWFFGIDMGSYQGITREWLYWYNQAGERLLTPEERIEVERESARIERERAEAEKQRAEEEK